MSTFSSSVRAILDLLFLKATISSARVQPLRRRPLFSLYRERPPLFEKSNVLVMWVSPVSVYRVFLPDLQRPYGIWYVGACCGPRTALEQTFQGKTLLARTLAKVLDVPFSVSDATAFTQVCLHLIFSSLF